MLAHNFFLEVGVDEHHHLPILNGTGFDTADPDIVGDLADILLIMQILQNP